MERVKASPLTKPEYLTILNNIWSDERVTPYALSRYLRFVKKMKIAINGNRTSDSGQNETADGCRDLTMGN